MKIKKSILEDLDLPNSAIEDTILANSRWSILHRIIFEYEGKFYRAYYSIGATEYQDESPWENKDEVECTEVHQVEVMTKQWEEIK